MCLPAEPPEMTAVGAPAGQTKQVGHQHAASMAYSGSLASGRAAGASLMGAEPARRARAQGNCSPHSRGGPIVFVL